MKVNKKTLAINLLAVFLATFIILFSVFAYKYFNLKDQTRENEGTVVLKGIDLENQEFYQEQVDIDEFMSLEKVLSATGDFEMTSSEWGAFVTGVGGKTTEGNQFWSLSSKTHKLCRNEVEFSCSVGVSDLYLSSYNEFVFTLSTF